MILERERRSGIERRHYDREMPFWMEYTDSADRRRPGAEETPVIDVDKVQPESASLKGIAPI